MLTSAHVRFSGRSQYGLSGERRGVTNDNS